MWTHPCCLLFGMAFGFHLRETLMLQARVTFYTTSSFQGLRNTPATAWRSVTGRHKAIPTQWPLVDQKKGHGVQHRYLRHCDSLVADWEHIPAARFQNLTVGLTSGITALIAVNWHPSFWNNTSQNHTWVSTYFWPYTVCFCCQMMVRF